MTFHHLQHFSRNLHYIDPSGNFWLADITRTISLNCTLNANIVFTYRLNTKRAVPNVALRRKEFELRAENSDWRRLSGKIIPNDPRLWYPTINSNQFAFRFCFFFFIKKENHHIKYENSRHWHWGSTIYLRILFTFIPNKFQFYSITIYISLLFNPEFSLVYFGIFMQAASNVCRF